MEIAGWIAWGVFFILLILSQLNEWDFARQLKQSIGCNSIRVIANTHWYILDGVEYDNGGNRRRYYNYLFCLICARGLSFALIVFLCFPSLPKVCLIFAPLVLGGVYWLVAKKQLRSDAMYLTELEKYNFDDRVIQIFHKNHGYLPYFKQYDNDVNSFCKMMDIWK
jgi:hypothetical protein